MEIQRRVENIETLKETGTLGDALEETTALVQNTFREVWDAFFQWENEYSRQQLRALHTSSAQTSGLSSFESSWSLQEYATAMDNLAELDMPTSIETEVIDISIDPSLSETRYESGPLTLRNTMTGDDSSAMKYIPFADDPAFDPTDNVDKYRSFSWQDNVQTPDTQFLVAETVYRLYFQHGLSLLHIDETCVLPLPVLTSKGTTGISRAFERRDFPPWPHAQCLAPNARKLPSDSLAFLPHESLEKVDLANSFTLFCSNPNCMHSYCDVHYDPLPMPRKLMPKVNNALMVDTVLDPCTKDCFILAAGLSTLDTYWSEEDAAALQTVLEFSPDLCPCDLAIICKKPCREVYKRRKALIPDQLIAHSAAIRDKESKKSKPEFEDFLYTMFTPNEPCGHDGVCDETSQCPCALNKSHCSSSCRCPTTCKRRWAGCKCAHRKDHKPICRTPRCICYKAGRECDPALCLKCDAREEHPACGNVGLQKHWRKLTEAREGVWGLGLYILEDALENDIIAEYVGELIYEATTDSRADLSTHRGRNYLFGLNSTVSIDSEFIGNDTRYINHDPERSNCKSRVKLVNGEHRIGIYASMPIAKGTELYLDYGKDFFAT